MAKNDGGRIFKPGALVRGTLQGRLGERVDVLVQRGGSTRTISVPRARSPRPQHHAAEPAALARARAEGVFADAGGRAAG